MMEAAEYANTLTETQFQEKVIARAKARGWLVHHARPAYSKDGQRVMTPIQGDTGFPDLVLARGRRIIIVELKSEQGRLQGSQREWLTQMVGDGNGRAPTRRIQESVPLSSYNSQIETVLLVTVWYPSDWPEVCEVLE